MKPSLLIVDDEELILEILLEALTPLHVECHTATNGREALAFLAKTRPHAVLSDIHMPEMDGFELLANATALGVEVPFVFLTGYGDKEKAITALRLGALDFLEK